jgi:hypothetical protein
VYKQTDSEVAIYAWTTDTTTGYYAEHNVIKLWGCLFISLLYLCERVTNRFFSPSQIKLLYEYCCLKNIIRKDTYVLRHDDVIRAGLKVLGYGDIHVVYHGKRGTYKKGNMHLMQIKTPNGNGHFRHKDFDPYDPEIPIIQHISDRDYTIDILNK